MASQRDTVLQDALTRFTNYVSKMRLKMTPQRRSILEAFFEAGDHLTSEELYTRVKHRQEGVGQATVYRTLKLLCESGLAKEVDFGDGVARYEPFDESCHHDHLICERCGKNVEVLDENIERSQEALAARHGFTLTGHKLFLYGICPDCRRAC